jgi:ribulose-5-phosphate 4-epimerase/fuculose-1-phosphate aldolase
MRNHGVLCCAENTQAALQTVEDLERLARDRLCSRITAQTILNPQRAAILRGVLALMEVT